MSPKNGSIQRRIKLTNQHGVSGQKHDTSDTGWDESYWDDTSHWNCEPQYLTDSFLDLLSAIQDGSVDGSSVSESENGDVQVTMSAMNNAARTFTAARAC